jgi:hypothetical protein
MLILVKYSVKGFPEALELSTAHDKLFEKGIAIKVSKPGVSVQQALTDKALDVTNFDNYSTRN